MVEKKVPMRKCCACRQMKSKFDLIRIVKDKDDIVSIDLTGKKSGRGTYLCKDSKCIDLAKKKKSIDHELGVTIQSSIYDNLMENLNG